jgi:hypothetical protein
MGKMEMHIAELKKQVDWIPYLMDNSNLPSPRANLELAYAVARTANRELAEKLIAADQPGLSVQSPLTFVVLCGLMALGKYASGEPAIRATLRRFASDSRWRVREGVAMALQLWGEQDSGTLMAEMADWAEGNLFEQRAAIAGICEPSLLGDEETARAALSLLDEVTRHYVDYPNPKDEAFRVLTLGLSYGWSVAVAVLPDAGKPLMEKWFAHPHAGVQKVMKENLTKKRLEKMDAAWVEKMKAA